MRNVQTISDNWAPSCQGALFIGASTGGKISPEVANISILASSVISQSNISSLMAGLCSEV